MIDLEVKPISEYSRGELAVLILGVVAGVILIAGAVAVAPGLGVIIKLFKPKNAAERQRLVRTVDALKRKRLISEIGDHFETTAYGKRQAEYDSLVIKKRKWDGRWRLVMFDIPESQRPARLAISRKILEMGMMHVQDSVFISPYPCEKEITTAAEYLRVAKYIQIAEVTRITNESFFKKLFEVGKF